MNPTSYLLRRSARSVGQLIQSGHLALALCLLLAVPASAAENYPPEVAKYLERREVCEHFRGEPWPEGSTTDDAERRLFIADQFARYCRGADQALEKLKQKYRGNKAVSERLDQYEADVEGPQ